VSLATSRTEIDSADTRFYQPGTGNPRIVKPLQDAVVSILDSDGRDDLSLDWCAPCGAVEDAAGEWCTRARGEGCRHHHDDGIADSRLDGARRQLASWPAVNVIAPPMGRCGIAWRAVSCALIGRRRPLRPSGLTLQIARRAYRRQHAQQSYEAGHEKPGRTHDPCKRSAQHRGRVKGRASVTQLRERPPRLEPSPPVSASQQWGTCYFGLPTCRA
jgi:hypothetical protein